jgi:hypothetical protein
MQRAEKSFRSLHDRVLALEERQAWKGPSDEQVERVLRKILAERFTDTDIQRVENPNVMKDGAFFVKNPKQDAAILQAIPIDVASLHVDPKAIPSKAYGQALEMLEGTLPSFPKADMTKTGYEDYSRDGADSTDKFKVPKAPLNNQQHRKPW